MELNSLWIQYCKPCTKNHRQTVPCILTTIGRDLENLSTATGSKHGRPGQNPDESPLLLKKNHRTGTPTFCKEQFGGNALIHKRYSTFDGFPPGSVHDTFTGPVRLENSAECRTFPEVKRVPAESPFAESSVLIAAEMHASVLQPNNLFPCVFAYLLDDVLIAGTIGPFPGVKHMIDDSIRRIGRIDGSQSSLGGRGVGFLRVRNLCYRNQPTARLLLQNLRSTAHSCASCTDDKHITMKGFGCFQGIVHESGPLYKNCQMGACRKESPHNNDYRYGRKVV